jgi:KipI family sensor histidine kinase inhibitor
MTPRLLPAGDRAVLLHTDDLATNLAVTAHLRRAGIPEIEDLIPASETVLIRLVAGVDIVEFGNRLLTVAAGVTVEAGDDGCGNPLLIPVRYDGPDLSDVAAATGLSIPEIIKAHTETPRRAAFVGFAPGFAYLAGGDPRLAVPRRAESRPSVAAGSVGLAGEFSAVYPRQSPGGWQLIGFTDQVLWDIDDDPPAAIQPGAWVRFVDIDATEPHTVTDGRTGAASTADHTSEI